MGLAEAASHSMEARQPGGNQRCPVCLSSPRLSLRVAWPQAVWHVLFDVHVMHHMVHYHPTSRFKILCLIQDMADAESCDHHSVMLHTREQL